MTVVQGVSSASPDLNTSSWYNLALISDSASYSGTGDTYHMLLTGLDTDCQYEVRLIINYLFINHQLININLGEAESNEQAWMESTQ